MKTYHYFFYKFYRFWDYISMPKVWSDWKAVLSMVIIEILLLASIPFYYSAFSQDIYYIDIMDIKTLIPFLSIIFVNYVAFIRDDNWKRYLKDFQHIPPKKNILGGIIVWGITLLIFANFIFSVWLFYRK